LGSLWKGKLLDFRLVETFFENIKAFRSYDIQIMIQFLTLRQFICPLSLFLKEMPFASLTNAIDVKIERVLTGFLIGWNRFFSQSKSPLELSQFSCLWRLSRMISFKNRLKGHINWRKVRNFIIIWMDESI
jgi:hypothetical protein